MARYAGTHIAFQWPSQRISGNSLLLLLCKQTYYIRICGLEPMWNSSSQALLLLKCEDLEDCGR